MKRIIYSIVTVVVLAVTSCSNNNSVNPRPTDQIVTKVTLSGRIKAELNNSVAGLENVPDGLKIVVGINTSNFALTTSSSNYVTKYYETTSTGGNYSVEVEVGPYGNPAVVNFPTFRADVAINNTTNLSTLFPSASRTVNLVKGQNAIQDYNY